jgi:spermidine/putrescine-binding protein
MVAKLQAQSKANRVTWDLVEPDEYEILALAKRGLVRKLPADVKADLIKAVGSEHVTDYGILSAAYADVLVCNRDAVKRCPKNAAEFWDVKGFPGRRTMYGDGWLESAVAAVQADGVPRDQVFPPDMDRAYRKLDEIKPDVAVWWKTGDQSQQIFRDEEVAMGYMWDGRAYGLLDQGVNVEISHDGSPLHRTLFVVTKDAPNPEAAYAFLRWFATHPRNQAEWVKKMHYGLPHPDVFKYLPEDVAEQIATFPANADVSVRVDPQWAASNQARELKRWADWIGR